MLICPVCGEKLNFDKRQGCCSNGHCFDVAKEGYINLLRSSKSGDKIGDDKVSARSRHSFLEKGYYQPLADALSELLRGSHGALMDICCGEGYYSDQIQKKCDLQVYGFDISKEMVRLAAKRKCGKYFVANLAAIPVCDASFDVAIHLFAPFKETEFARIMKKGGMLYAVIPGEKHLFGLKQAIYDTPYLNDEKLPTTEIFQKVAEHRVHANISLNSKEDIGSVFRMTPYYFHTTAADKEKLAQLDSLETEIDFLIAQYRLPEEV